MYRKLIKPNCSLSSRQTALVVGLSALGAAVLGLAFYSMGAWPVLAFFFAEAFGIAAAFGVVAMHRDDYELVTVDEARLCVARRYGARLTHAELQRYWARVYFNPRRGMQPSRLWVGSHGKRFELAVRAHEQARAALARELAELLRR